MICGSVVRHSQSDGQRFHRSALAILIVQLFLNKEQLQAAQVDSALDILVQVIRKDGHSDGATFPASSMPDADEILNSEPLYSVSQHMENSLSLVKVIIFVSSSVTQ